VSFTLVSERLRKLNPKIEWFKWWPFILWIWNQLFYRKLPPSQGTRQSYFENLKIFEAGQSLTKRSNAAHKIERIFSRMRWQADLWITTTNHISPKSIMRIAMFWS
jgi:hypothetical protein